PQVPAATTVTPDVNMSGLPPELLVTVLLFARFVSALWDVLPSSRNVELVWNKEKAEPPAPCGQLSGSYAVLPLTIAHTLLPFSPWMSTVLVGHGASVPQPTSKFVPVGLGITLPVTLKFAPPVPLVPAKVIGEAFGISRMLFWSTVITP